jgi:hypothetical protein
MIGLNDLLEDVGLQSASTLVMRHRPLEPSLRKVLPWLIADRPDLFLAFQSEHSPTVERMLKKASTLASFVADGAGRALFVGIYAVRGYHQITHKRIWAIPENQELKALGMRGPRPEHNPLWFDLELVPELANLCGRLVVAWPGGERAWTRWADRNSFPIHAIHEESVFSLEMSAWNELLLTWQELKVLPRSWQQKLAQWRGIYYIRDSASGKGYVGSACGAENIWGRWSNYAASGHGGNRLLRDVNPENLSFSILQRVSPDLSKDDVIGIENSWKLRLQTRAPQGLNDN